MWYDEGKHQKETEGGWLNDAPHGLRNGLVRKRKKQSTFTFVRGVLHGPLHRWNPDGSPSLDTAYLNGLQHGIRIEYFPNGQKKTEGAFVKNIYQGYFRGWFQNGNPSEESYLVDGLMDGLLKAWPRPDSKGPDEWTYKGGHRQGRSTYYFPNGSLKHDFLYDNDRLVYRRGDGIDVFLEKLADLLQNEPQSFGVYPTNMKFDSGTFLRVFGVPDSDVGRTDIERTWAYRCQDGVLSLKVTVHSDRVLVEDVAYSHRENTISSRMSSNDIEAVLISKLPDDLKSGFGGSNRLIGPWYDADWFFDSLGYPNGLTSLNTTGQKYYVYKCADGVVGLKVQETYRQVTPRRADVGTITIKSFDRR